MKGMIRLGFSSKLWDGLKFADAGSAKAFGLSLVGTRRWAGEGKDFSKKSSPKAKARKRAKAPAVVG